MMKPLLESRESHTKATFIPNPNSWKSYKLDLLTFDWATSSIASISFLRIHPSVQIYGNKDEAHFKLMPGAQMVADLVYQERQVREPQMVDSA